MAASRAPSCRIAHLLCTAHWQKALDEYLTLESDVQNVWNQLTEQHRRLFTKHPRLVHEWTDHGEDWRYHRVSGSRPSDDAFRC